MKKSSSLRIALVGAPVAGALLVTGVCRVGADEPMPAQVATAPQIQDVPVQRLIPPELEDTSMWLSRLRAEQLKTAASMGVFSAFQFADRIAESGITFKHRIVDDAGKTYKAAHYDHGNGIAIADVDRDGLADIYFTSQVGGNQLWKNLGGGKFRDITASAGVALRDRVGVTASFADIDNDGDADLYATTVRGGNALFENDGRGRFTDISASSGLGYVGHSSGAVFFDYNRDGRLDLFLVNVGQYTTDVVGGEEYKFHVAFDEAFSGHLYPERSEQSRLYRNEGRNRFVDVSATVGLQDISWSGDASPIDVNDDGWLDLYVVNMQGNDEYYENVSGQRFVKKSREVFPRTSWGAMGIKVIDFNNDGHLDVFITDMHSDMSQVVSPDQERRKSQMRWPKEMVGDGSTSIWGNSAFRKEGPGLFKEVSDEINLESYWPWGLSVGDLNADGWEDVFIASGMNYPFRYGINSVKLNDRGLFRDAEFIVGIEPRREGRVATPWFELDMSGKDAGHLDGIGLTGRVSIWGALASRSSVIFDLDGDGDLDIVTNDFNSEPMVLISNLTESTKVQYVAITLSGTRSNRSGLGALIRLKAGGSTYTKVYDGKSGYLSQSSAPVYFGLGAADSVQEIEVMWPSGTRQLVKLPIRINSTIEIRER
jgi:hypothetical protein